MDTKEKTTVNTLEEALTYVEFYLFRSCPGVNDEDPVWTEVKRLAAVGAQAEAELKAFEQQFPKNATTQSDEVITSVEKLEVINGSNLKELQANLPDRFRSLKAADGQAAPPQAKSS